MTGTIAIVFVSFLKIVVIYASFHINMKNIPILLQMQILLLLNNSNSNADVAILHVSADVNIKLNATVY